MGGAFLPAFTAFEDSSAAAFFQPLRFSLEGFYITRDFSTTVLRDHDYISDLYQRPVQWIAVGRTNPVEQSTPMSFVVMSPWEVNSLYADLVNSARVSIHLYRINLTFPSIEPLLLNAVPSPPSSWAASSLW